MTTIGFVTIGRNEGERLIRCLRSLLKQLSDAALVVYVDSGSTDGSVAAARDLGVSVIELDMTIPFTMARGRNAGFQYLVDHYPDLEFVQFLDGDCELLDTWIDQALPKLQQHPELAIVCGRRRERFPDHSAYNRLADMEWNTPVGEAMACGGDSLARVAAIREVGGFTPTLICGEEPEMCIRLRAKGWKIYRIEADMTLHDAAITRFGQWWKRMTRAGWAVAEGQVMHGQPPESYMQREMKSGWLWGVGIPLLALGLAWPTHGLSLLLLLGYGVLGWRIYQGRVAYGDSRADARLYALFCTLSKFPQVQGQSQYWINRWRGQPAQLIEYKTPSVQG